MRSEKIIIDFKWTLMIFFISKSKTRGWLVRERGLEEVNANRNIEEKG